MSDIHEPSIGPGESVSGLDKWIEENLIWAGDIGNQVVRVDDLRGFMKGKVLVDTQAAADVMAERRRQISAEGWTPEHDDSHRGGEIALAGACYACNAAGWLGARPRFKSENLDKYKELSEPGFRWPWNFDWWKPKNPRRDLIRAAALILAEIERLDRKAPPTTPDQANEQ